MVAPTRFKMPRYSSFPSFHCPWTRILYEKSYDFFFKKKPPRKALSITTSCWLTPGTGYYLEACIALWTRRPVYYQWICWTTRQVTTRWNQLWDSLGSDNTHELMHMTKAPINAGSWQRILACFGWTWSRATDWAASSHAHMCKRWLLR